MHRLSRQCHPMSVIINGQIAGGKGSGILHRTGTAQCRTNARQQLRRAKRLGDVIIGAAIQRRHLFLFLGAGGNYDHRQPVLLSQLPQQIQAIGVRQPQVQQQHVEFCLFQRCACLRRTGSDLYNVAVALQHSLHEVTDRKLVLYDQDLIQRFRPPLSAK